jgi:hypothetical protein
MLRLQAYHFVFCWSFLAILTSPINPLGLPIGIWALTTLLQPDVKESFRFKQTAIDWSTLFLGLGLLLPLTALLAFGMFMTGSAWLLAAFALLWFGLGMADVATDETPKEKTVNLLWVISFLLSLGLIAFAIWITHSAWPLATLAVGIVAAIAGIAAGKMGEASEEKEDGANEQAAADAVEKAEQEKFEEEEKKEEEEEVPKESLEWAAWCVGAVGAYRCWRLFADSDWSDIFATFTLSQFDSPRAFVLMLSGPIMLFAAIFMNQARLFWLSVTACVLCLLSGSCFSVIIAIWALFTLFDPRVRALFAANNEPSTNAGTVGAKPAKPADPELTRVYGIVIGSTLGHAVTAWWRERDSLFTRTVQTLLLLVHLGCLLAFLSFSGTGDETDQSGQEFTYDIGYPSPWYTSESTSQPDGSFSESSGIHWFSSAWIVAAFGLGLAYVYCQIEKARNPDAGFWHRPQTFCLVWVVLAIADMGLGTGMRQLGNNERLQDFFVGERINSSDVTNKKELIGEADPQIGTLMQAAATGQIGRIRQLMEQGVDVNDKASDGQTVLMAAAANGQVSTSLSLIVMGANPNEKDNNGLTALMVAASAGHADVIVALFQLESAAEDARALDASPDDAAATFK